MSNEPPIGSEKPDLSPVSHTFSENSHTLSPDLHRRHSQAVLSEHCPCHPEDESQVTERRFSSKKCEKPGLSVHQLSVNYEKTPVLWDISLEVPQGTLTAVIGPNGAGKSTFLKALLGLIKPLSGNSAFFGHPLKTVRKKVAYVPQRESVDWDFPITVFDLVLMGRYGRRGLFGRPSRSDRQDVLQCLAKVGLESFESRQISQLSGGQQQRAFLARALIQEAELYLMDEPFAGIDIASSKTIVSILQSLRDNGKTLFVVHHDLESVPRIFDWVILLNVRLVGCGPVHETFNPELIQKTFASESLLLDEAARLSKEKIAGFIRA